MQAEAGHGGRKYFAWLLPVATMSIVLVVSCSPTDIANVPDVPIQDTDICAGPFAEDRETCCAVAHLTSTGNSLSAEYLSNICLDTLDHCLWSWGGMPWTTGGCTLDLPAGATIGDFNVHLVDSEGRASCKTERSNYILIPDTAEWRLDCANFLNGAPCRPPLDIHSFLEFRIPGCDGLKSGEVVQQGAPDTEEYCGFLGSHSPEDCGSSNQPLQIGTSFGIESVLVPGGILHRFTFAPIGRVRLDWKISFDFDLHSAGTIMGHHEWYDGGQDWTIWPPGKKATIHVGSFLYGDQYGTEVWRWCVEKDGKHIWSSLPASAPEEQCELE